MAEEVKHLYRVAWEDPKDPDKVCIIMETLTIWMVRHLVLDTQFSLCDRAFKQIGTW